MNCDCPQTHELDEFLLKQSGIEQLVLCPRAFSRLVSHCDVARYLRFSPPRFSYMVWPKNYDPRRASSCEFLSVEIVKGRDH